MPPPVLELEDLTVRYGRFTALRGVSAVFSGGALGLLGPNGAGKSTMLRAVLGLVSSSGGRIRVLGRDAHQEGTALRRHIGYMPERDSWLAGMSGVSALAHLAEICGLPHAEAMVRAHDVLHFVGLGEERYREVSDYSVGMRQRYKLAAALVHDPDLMILDEPTNGLDPQGRVRMLDLIHHVCREHGVHLVVASHLLPDVERLCDQVWVLDQGELRRADTLEHLTAAARGARRVRLGSEAEALRLRDAARRAGLAATEDRGRPREITLVGQDGLVDPREVFALARGAGVQVLAVKPAARSLEDAFLEALEVAAGEPQDGEVR